MYRIDRRFAAQSAARAGENVACEPLEIDRHFGREKDIQDIASFVAIAMLDAEQILRTVDDSLGEKKAGGQFGVVARRAHRHTDGPAANADLQWLFLGEIIFLLTS